MTDDKLRAARELRAAALAAADSNPKLAQELHRKSQEVFERGMTDDTLRAAQVRIQLIDRVALRHEIAAYGVHQRAEGDAEIVLRLIDRAPVVVEAPAALAASATDEGPREEFNERWCPNGCGAVLAPNTTHYDGADGYVCRPAAPVALQEQPE